MSTTHSGSNPKPARAALRLIALVMLGIAVVVAAQAAGLLNERSSASAGTGAIASPTQLHSALLKGDVKALNETIKAGADVNQTLNIDLGGNRERAGMTPLILAAAEGSADSLEALLKAGAKTESRTADGRTALIYAAGWGDGAKVKLLIDAKANLDARAADGMTAVMFASARGDAAALKALLDAGCRINDKNKWGQSALMAAARSGSIEKVGSLLSAGADVSLSDQFGETALSIAASAEVGPEVLTALLAAGAKVETADNDGVTPLMKAAERGDAAQIQVLLAAGADKNRKDKINSWSAADWARKRDDEKGRQVVELLSK